MIPTLRRSRDDIFLIGEEQILTDQEAGRDPDPMFESGEDGGRSCRRAPRSPHLHGSLQGARGLALLGLGAGAVAVLAALELGGGHGPAQPPEKSPPRSPLISRSPAGVPAGPTARVHRPAASPAEVPRPTVAHHHRSRPTRHPVSSGPPVTASGSEREPTLPVAPVSSLAVTPTDPAPAPEAPAAATAQPTPPGPPPSSSGGGPAGVESFGFEG